MINRAEDAQPWQAHIHLPFEMSSLDCMARERRKAAQHRTAGLIERWEGESYSGHGFFSKHMASASEPDLS
jgi:hypothetical protein